MKKKLIFLFAVMFVFLSVMTVSAVDYPTRPVRVLVGYGPGGGNDLTSRLLMDEVSEILGQPFRVENIPGASGTVAATIASKADPDGYEIFFTVTDTTAVQPNLIDVDFSLDDFRGIAGFSYQPTALAVRADSPWETLDDLLAEADTGKVINRGHSGVGGVAHIFLEMFFPQTDLDSNDVPFDGGAVAISNLLGGHVDVVAGTPGAMVPYMESEELRLLGIAADERSAHFPEVPTFKEYGFDLSVGVDFFMVAPADTPDEIVQTLEAAVLEAAKSDAFKAFVDERRQDHILRSGDEILDKVKQDQALFGEMLE